MTSRPLALCTCLVLAACAARARARVRPAPALRHANGCTAPASDAPTEWTLSARTLRRDGTVLRDPVPANGAVTVVVMGGPHGDTGASTDAALRRLGERVARTHPQVVAVLGGLDGEGDALDAWLRVMVPNDVPVLLVPADVEDVSALRAVARTRANLVDATRVRLYTSAGVELVTLPGAQAGPCAITDAEITTLGEALPPAAASRVLITASAPLQSGTGAIDRGLLGVHVGGTAVAELVTRLAPRGVAALVPRESAGTLTQAPDGTFALSVGAASGVPFETVERALTAPVAWAIRVAPGSVRVERLDP